MTLDATSTLATAYVQADSPRTDQVLSNLADNVQRHTPAAGEMHLCGVHIEQWNEACILSFGGDDNRGAYFILPLVALGARTAYETPTDQPPNKLIQRKGDGE